MSKEEIKTLLAIVGVFAICHQVAGFLIATVKEIIATIRYNRRRKR